MCALAYLRFLAKPAARAKTPAPSATAAPAAEVKSAVVARVPDVLGVAVLLVRVVVVLFDELELLPELEEPKLILMDSDWDTASFLQPSV